LDAIPAKVMKPTTPGRGWKADEPPALERMHFRHDRIRALSEVVAAYIARRKL
jgi:hypothetical protein